MNTSFANTLAQIREGDCLHELSEKMQELVASVRETGRGGKLTFTLSVKPATLRGAIGSLVIDDEVTVKVPKPEKAQSLFYATDDNTLQRNDPRQKELNLKTVEGSLPDEVKEVDQVAANQ